MTAVAAHKLHRPSVGTCVFTDNINQGSVCMTCAFPRLSLQALSRHVFPRHMADWPKLMTLLCHDLQSLHTPVDVPREARLHE